MRLFCRRRCGGICIVGTQLLIKVSLCLPGQARTGHCWQGQGSAHHHWYGSPYLVIVVAGCAHMHSHAKAGWCACAEMLPFRNIGTVSSIGRAVCRADRLVVRIHYCPILTHTRGAPKPCHQSALVCTCICHVACFHALCCLSSRFLCYCSSVPMKWLLICPVHRMCMSHFCVHYNCFP